MGHAGIYRLEANFQALVELLPSRSLRIKHIVKTFDEEYRKEFETSRQNSPTGPDAAKLLALRERRELR